MNAQLYTLLVNAQKCLKKDMETEKSLSSIREILKKKKEYRKKCKSPFIYRFEKITSTVEDIAERFFSNFERGWNEFVEETFSPTTRLFCTFIFFPVILLSKVGLYVVYCILIATFLFFTGFRIKKHRTDYVKAMKLLDDSILAMEKKMSDIEKDRSAFHATYGNPKESIGSFWYNTSRLRNLVYFVKTNQAQTLEYAKQLVLSSEQSLDKLYQEEEERRFLQEERRKQQETLDEIARQGTKIANELEYRRQNRN